MERISIFNYEAYYLDYLEGNLNEEESALLLAFLEEHPECKLEDAELPEFDVEKLWASYELKQSLLQTDDSDTITAVNLDHFLIARAEGVLNEEKKQELDAFVRENGLEREEQLVQLTYFTPDLTQRYADKSALKQGRTIALWPYIAAAASLILFFMLFPTDDTAGKAQGGLVADDKKNDKALPKEKNEKINAPVNYLSDGTQIAESEQWDEVPEKPSVNDPYKERENIAIEADRLAKRELLSYMGDKNLQPISTSLTSAAVEEVKEKNNQNDFAFTAFDDLKNPIEPITKILSDKTKRDIDFRSGESKKNDSRGFYLKIGNLEVSRRAH